MEEVFFIFHSIFYSLFSGPQVSSMGSSSWGKNYNIEKKWSGVHMYRFVWDHAWFVWDRRYNFVTENISSVHFYFPLYFNFGTWHNACLALSLKLYYRYMCFANLVIVKIFVFSFCRERMWHALMHVTMWVSTSSGWNSSPSESSSLVRSISPSTYI
jgi:hypothetical protein